MVTSDVPTLKAQIADKLNRDGKAPTIVFNSHVIALGVVRSLGRRGIPIIALDRDPRGIALYSRYVTLRGLCPNPLDGESGFADFLLEIGDAFSEKPVLFPCMDEWVMATARYREELEEYYQIPFATFEVIKRILGKTTLYKTSERLGIPIPRTYYLDEEPAEQVARKLSYPSILKPEYKREFYEKYHSSVLVVRSPQHLVREAKELQHFGVMVQEIIPTSKESLYTFGSYISRSGEALGEFVGQRLEIYPPGFGTTCLVTSKEVEEVRENGLRILKDLGYQGISEVEFIHDKRDGQYKLLDINTRPWKWIGLPIAAGVDLPYLAYSDANGSPQRSPKQKDGVTWMYLYDYAKLMKVTGELQKGFQLSRSNLLSLLRRPAGEMTVAGDYSEDDPGPFDFIVENAAYWEGEGA